WNRVGSCSTAMNITWNGRDRRGNTVAPGTYTISVKVCVNGSPTMCTNEASASVAVTGAATPQPSPGAACTDSDAGLDYNTKGYVYFNGQYYHDFCSGEQLLYEHYCKDDSVKFATVSPPSGYICQDGRFVPKSQASPTPGATPSNYYTCQDTDGGNDIYNAGKVIVYRPSGSVYREVGEYCISEDWLKETYCTKAQAEAPINMYALDTIPCPEGYKCTFGACRKTAPYSIALPEKVYATLNVSSTEAKVGELISFTITAYDAHGVISVYLHDGTSWHKYSCDLGPTCEKTITKAFSAPGVYRYYGYAYGITEDGEPEGSYTDPLYVEVVVHA
ncbi:MAG: hypothetical protein J7L44_03520, partial [Candidatus Diapherotrites archaeon]|nr:hypothetical protein [Candidatus Diapherotrites archaeon]